MHRWPYGPCFFPSILYPTLMSLTPGTSEDAPDAIAYTPLLLSRPPLISLPVSHCLSLSLVLFSVFVSLSWPLASTSCSLSRDFFSSDSSPQTYFSGENFILIVFLIPFSSFFLSFFYSVFFYSIFFFLLFLVSPKRIFSENPSHFFFL